MLFWMDARRLIHVKRRDKCWSKLDKILRWDTMIIQDVKFLTLPSTRFAANRMGANMLTAGWCA